MQDICCPLCKNASNKKVFITGDFELRTCDICDLNFIHPYLQKEENRNPLSVEKQVAGEERSVSGYFKYVSSHFGNISSYLDIGCGCGGLLKKAKEFDIALVNGIEDDIERANYASKYANCEIFDSLRFKSDQARTYDLISLINVFSHISDLDLFFRQLRQMLNTNGKVIIKTGLFKRGFRKNNLFDWQIPEHIHFIGDNTIDYIAKKYNFNCIENIQIPLAEELITRDFLLSPGLSWLRNFLKKVIYYTPGSSFLLRKTYTWFTRNRLYSSIVILQKEAV